MRYGGLPLEPHLSSHSFFFRHTFGETAVLLRLKSSSLIHARSVYGVGETAVAPVSNISETGSIACTFSSFSLVSSSPFSRH